MANNFLNTNWVSMDILRLLLNKLEVAEYFNRSWERDFEKEFAPGAAITVKFPQRFFTSDGMGYAPQGINRISTTVSLDQWIQIAFEWDDYERAVKLERSEEELRENYLDPAGAAMAQEWDNRCAKFAHLNTSQLVGILGTDPTSVAAYYAARRLLKEMACPPGKRCMLISSSMMATLGANITSIFNPKDEISKMWKEGYILGTRLLGRARLGPRGADESDVRHRYHRDEYDDCTAGTGDARAHRRHCPRRGSWHWRLDAGGAPDALVRPDLGGMAPRLAHAKRQAHLYRPLLRGGRHAADRTGGPPDPSGATGLDTRSVML